LQFNVAFPVAIEFSEQMQEDMKNQIENTNLAYYKKVKKEIVG